MSESDRRRDRDGGRHATLALLPQWLRRLTLYCLAGLTVVVTLWLVAQALFAVQAVTVGVVVAVLLAALMYPVTDALDRARVPRWVAALATLLLLLGVFVATVYFVVRSAVGQFDDLTQTVTEAIDNAREFLVGPPLGFSQQRIDEISNRLVDFVQQAAPSAATGATLFVEFLSAIGIALFVLFFLLKDGPTMWGWALSWVPVARCERVDGAGASAWTTLTNYVHGAVGVAVLDAVFIGAAMFVLGVPLALSLTLLVFLGAFVPFVGATVSGALAVLVTLVTLGPIQAVILLGVVLLVQFLEGNILQPFIVGHAVRLHPVAILLAVSVGATLAGVIGAVIAVPVVAVSYRVVDYLARHDSAPR